MSRDLDLNDEQCRADLTRLTVTGAIGGVVLAAVLGEGAARLAAIGALVGAGFGVLSCTQDPAATASDDDDDEGGASVPKSHNPLTTTKDGTAKPGNSKDGTVSLMDGFTVLAGDDVDDYSFTVEGAS